MAVSNVKIVLPVRSKVKLAIVLVQRFNAIASYRQLSASLGRSLGKLLD